MFNQEEYRKQKEREIKIGQSINLATQEWLRLPDELRTEGTLDALIAKWFERIEKVQTKYQALGRIESEETKKKVEESQRVEDGNNLDKK